MRIRQVILCVSLTTSVLVIAALSYTPWSQEVTLIEGNQGIVIERFKEGIVMERFNCSISLVQDKSRAEIWLGRKNTCSKNEVLDDGALWDYLAAHKALTRRLFEGIDGVYLGDTRFAEGPFLFCDLLARLSEDNQWTADIDSHKAATVLERILPRTKLVPSVQATFANAGKSIKSVTLEVVFLRRTTAGIRCPKVPEKIPLYTFVDIAFEP